MQVHIGSVYIVQEFPFLFCIMHHAICPWFILQAEHYQNYKPEEDYCNLYLGMEYSEGEDGELSWFNVEARAGVGIGLSICLGVEMGVTLLVRTYQGTWGPICI